MAHRKLMRQLNPVLYTTDLGYYCVPLGNVPSASDKVIIGCHGASGDAFQYGLHPLAPHTTALLAAGYIVVGLDHARINSWGDPDATRAVQEARTTLASMGHTRTKMAGMGWSMGGATILNVMKRNLSVWSGAWLWNPVTDLRWFHDGSGSYTPAYSNLNGATQGGRTAEIDGTYSASSAAVGAYTIPAAGGSGITMTITTNTGKSFADGNNSGTVGLPQATVNARAFTYTSKTDSTLVGCLATTGTTIAVTNGLAITSSYAAQSNGYRIYDEPTQWTSGPPIVICQASDDTTVPPGMNLDATNGFIAKAGGSVTRRNPNPTGDHIVSIANIPSAEVVAFYDGLTW